MAANIDVNELIGILNTQLANQNLELQVSKLQVATLQKEVEELTKKLEKISSDQVVKPKTR
jgi:hypothetical protein